MLSYFTFILVACQLKVICHAAFNQPDSLQLEFINQSMNWEKAKERFDSLGSKSVWGPQLWHNIHCIALNYPKDPSKQDKENYKIFYSNLDQIIPCSSCSIHYQENIQNFSMDQSLNTTMDLFNFTINFHNLVNEQTNKSFFSLDDAIQLYQNTCSIYNGTASNVQDIIDRLVPQTPDIIPRKKHFNYVPYVMIGIFIVLGCCGYLCHRRVEQRRKMDPLLQIIDVHDEAFDEDLYQIIDMDEKFDSPNAKIFIA